MNEVYVPQPIVNIDRLYERLDNSMRQDWIYTSEEYELARFARCFAMAAHTAHGDKRKYTGEPYYFHVFEVAKILDWVKGYDVAFTQLAAAYLHDVIEDTNVTYQDINTFFGKTVADLVLELSDISRPEDGNRFTRKQIDLAHYAGISSEAADVKLADLISNTRSIVEHNPKFAQVYLKEKEALLSVLQHADPRMIAVATQALNLGKAKIYGEESK